MIICDICGKPAAPEVSIQPRHELPYWEDGRWCKQGMHVIFADYIPLERIET